MNEKIFQTTEELANFINQKAGEGFTNVCVSVGSIIVSVRTADLLQSTQKLQGFVITYSLQNDKLIIGDII